MKKLGLIFSTLLLGIYSLVAQSMEQVVADRVIPLSNNEDFEFLLPLLQDKRIVIIGEANHLAGSTCEVRVNMIRYLSEHLGFNTVALEPLGFIDGMLLRDSMSDGKQPDIRKSLPAPDLFVHQKSEPLWEMIMNRKIDFMGFSDFPVENIFEILNKENIGENIDFERLERLACFGKDTIPQADIDFAIQAISTLENRLNFKKATDEKQYHKMDFLLQGLENIKTEFLAHLAYVTEGIVPYVSLGDRQRADNIIWYMNRFPESKLIVWVANYHALKNIWHLFGDIYFDDAAKYDVMGDLLADYFGDQLYSIAVTSATGLKVTYDEDDNTIEEMVDFPLVEPNSLEYQLYQKNIDYGYIDLAPFCKDDTYYDSPFVTHIEMKVAYNGKWQYIFDGIYYIRKMYPRNP